MSEPTRAGRKGLPAQEQNNLNFGKSWFLGIGINAYQEFTPLRNAVKDIEDIHRVLQEEYDLDEAILLLDKDATEDKIVAQLEYLIEHVKSNDKLLIYYSGHGALNPKNKRGAWLPVDARPNVRSSFIRNSTIRDYVKDIQSFHTLLISDACFSGSILVRSGTRSTFNHLEELEQMRSRWAICSGRNMEEVSDGADGENSPFTDAVIKTLRLNQDALYNVAKLADRVMELTRGKYNQLPMYSPLADSGHEGGQYVFKRNVDENKTWELAAQTDTIQSYSDFIQQFPKGEFAEKAAQAMIRLQDNDSWCRFSLEHGLKAYQRYLDRFPSGQFANPAQQLMSVLKGIEPVFIPPTYSSHVSHSASPEAPSESTRPLSPMPDAAALAAPSPQEHVVDKNSFCVILDAGHGGISPQGIYTTQGKRHQHEKGTFHKDGTFYEGVFNRQMLNRIADRLSDEFIDFHELSHEYLDTSLSSRVSQANDLAKQYEHCLLVSLHANAFPTHSIRGMEFFINDAVETKGRPFATLLEKKCKEKLGDKINYRGIKSASFFLLKRTTMPAVLVEHLFYDQYEDALLLMDESVQDAFADAHVEAIWAYRMQVTGKESFGVG